MPKLPRLLNVNYGEDRSSEPVLTESSPKDSLPPSNMDEINERKKLLDELNDAFIQKIQDENGKLEEKLQKLNSLAKEIIKVLYTKD